MRSYPVILSLFTASLLLADDPPNGTKGPGITVRELSAAECRALISHIPEPFRQGIAHAKLVEELETVSFAFDYRGGPIRLWVEVEETGQETIARRFPKSGEDWRFAATEGHVCFALRRGVSERISNLASAAGKQSSREAVEHFLIYHATNRIHPDPKDNSHTSSVGHVNPLWYGWKKAKVEQTHGNVKPEPGKEVVLFTVKGEEVVNGANEPRKVTLSLKGVFGEKK